MLPACILSFTRGQRYGDMTESVTPDKHDTAIRDSSLDAPEPMTCLDGGGEDLGNGVGGDDIIVV